MKIASGPPGFSSLFMTHQNQADHTFWLHLWKNKQKMKTGWTTHSWNNAIWLAVRPCHMTMTHKINKLEKPGGPQGNFHALFDRYPTFYGHFRADVVTSEWSTRISSSRLQSVTGYLGLALSFAWDSALREKFNFCFWRVSSRIGQILIFEGGLHTMGFSDFPDVS